MNRCPLYCCAILAAGLTGAACGHIQRMDLPEEMSRVERTTEGTAPAIPAAHTPGPQETKRSAPTAQHAPRRYSPEGPQGQRLVAGLTVLAQGDADAAIAMAEGLLRDDPDNARAHCLLGMAYLQLDGAGGVPRPLFIALAEQELGHAIALVPDYPPALYHLAVVALRRGDVATAGGYLDGLRATGRATAAVATLEQAVGRGAPVILGGSE